MPVSALNMHHGAHTDFMDPTHELDLENVDSHIPIIQRIFYMLFYIGINIDGRTQRHKRAQLSLDGG